MRWRGPTVLRNRDFSLYWAGVVLSEIGVRGTLAVNLYNVYALTNSTALVGLIGLFQGVALVILSPLGGSFADRVDRRRPLQLTCALGGSSRLSGTRPSSLKRPTPCAAASRHWSRSRPAGGRRLVTRTWGGPQRSWDQLLACRSVASSR